MDTHVVRLTLDGVLLLRFNISSKLRLYMQSTSLSTIRRMCPFLLNLTGITTPACTRICTRIRICTTVLGILSNSPLLVYPIGDTTADAIRYATNAVIAVDTTVTGTPGPLDLRSPFQMSHTCTTNTATNTNHPSTFTVRIKVGPYSRQHPETSKCAQNAKSRRCTFLSCCLSWYHHPYV